MRLWFPTRIEINEWKVGAELTHYFEQDDIDPLPGTVLEWDPPRRVSFTWGSDTISFELSAAKHGGTMFVLTEELSANHAARNAAGWDACLDRLQLGAERERWTNRFERYVASFEPVLGHQDGPPEGVHDLDAGLLPLARSGQQAVEATAGLVQDLDGLVDLLGAAGPAHLCECGEHQHAGLTKSGRSGVGVRSDLFPRRLYLPEARYVFRSGGAE
jgi:Activator of Hsp90 ATPase homolog 1-like protein